MTLPAGLTRRCGRGWAQWEMGDEAQGLAPWSGTAFAFLLLTTSTAAAPGIAERDSVDSAGTEGNDFSASPATSQDGRFVAFHSYASNLVVADTNLIPDVFIRDRQAGTTTRMSVDTAGDEALGPGGGSYDAAISANGRFVAFDSQAVNLVPGDTNSSSDVFVRDRDTDNNGIFDEPASVGDN
jgi:Tol biopolymer transport system component